MILLLDSGNTYSELINLGNPAEFKFKLIELAKKCLILQMLNQKYLLNHYPMVTQNKENQI